MSDNRIGGPGDSNGPLADQARKNSSVKKARDDCAADRKLSEESKQLMEEEGRAGDRETAAEIAEIRAEKEAGSIAKQAREDDG